MRKLLPLLILSTLVLTILAFGSSIQAEIKKRELSSSPATNELASQSYVNRIFLSDGLPESDSTQGTWFNQSVAVPNTNLAALLASPPKINNVLGENSEEKWIEVDLSTQTLYAHEGNRTVYTFPVSTGLPWLPTVTGEFHIWAKLVSTRMTGGSKTDGTFYDLPNVPYTMYFYKGYGIHGAYWHHAFGHPRSHGCVNMDPNDAKTLFYWANPPLPEGKSALFNIPPEQSTRVVVHGTTPTNLN